jgi:hypothetical protein
MFHRVFLCVFACAAPVARAERTYRINVGDVKVEPIRGHLKLGGTNLRGDKIEVNSHYLEFNGKPMLPVIGEFHYCRYPDLYWDESLRKMKAGGIDIVASYETSGTGNSRVNAEPTGIVPLHVTADSQTWIGFLRKEKNVVWALLRRKIRLDGPLKLLVAFGKCFPQ